MSGTSYVVDRRLNPGPKGPLNRTRYFDAAGNEYWPCRCGEDHVGPYGQTDWYHHNCFHRQPLVDIGSFGAEPYIDGYYMCPECGEVFWLADKMEPESGLADPQESEGEG